MRARASIAALLAGAALLCASPAALAAPRPASGPALLAGAARLGQELTVLGPGPTPFGPAHGTLAELRFENGDGYTITVAAFGQTVAISVGRGDEAPSSTYLAHGRVGPTSIRASFAGRGRIAVRFRPTGDLLRGGHGAPCPAPDAGAIARLGVFVGTVRFRGEGGYTSTDAHRARGGAIDISAFVACLRSAARSRRAAPAYLDFPAISPTFAAAGRRTTLPPAPGVRTHPSRGPKPTTLLADGKQPLSRTLFSAQARGRRVRYLAIEERTDGSVGIVRFATAKAASPSFAADDALSLAGVTPPSPFSGTAAFQRGFAGAKSWAGSLAVSFPGAPLVPLTGPAFAVQLARGW